MDLTSSVAVEQVITDEVVDIFFGCKIPGGLGGTSCKKFSERYYCKTQIMSNIFLMLFYQYLVSGTVEHGF